MSFAHLALASPDVEATAAFLVEAVGWRRVSAPANSPRDVAWLEMASGQQLHLIHVEDFEISPFDREFGRHLAFFYNGEAFEQLKERIRAAGGEVIDAQRPTPFPRFFFREPINGYQFEVIDRQKYVIE
ncbi:MAG: VOC family protein [Phycisphaerae bacterium]|nr:VOC family protein [Phycisphaerae bacterium]